MEIFSFHISYTPLTSCTQVETEVRQAIEQSLEVYSRIDTAAVCDSFFIPLSSEDLQVVGERANEHILHQLYSRQSIVLEGEHTVWKYDPNIGESYSTY